MKRSLISLALVMAFSAPALASTCEDQNISHALKTYRDQCDGNLTSTAQSLANSSDSCIQVLEEGLEELEQDGEAGLEDVCTSALDFIQGYAGNNDVELLN
ncbi:MAG: hypothetical protein GC150_04215 [Rhizobiales bacterium]|nr:hypothetical protein [Hyphomicrobiales bacterium]